MHRTSRILALTTLLLPQAPPCSSPRRRLFRTRWPIRCFCWLWRFSASGGKRCFRSGLHSSCLPWAMRRVRRVCSFRRCCFRAGPRCLYPLFPLRRGTSCPSCRMAASRGVARVALRRGRAPGLGSGRTDRRRRLRCGHRRDALQRAPVSRGVCRMVPLRGPAVRFSDGVIAWSRFIGAVPGRTYVVMVPYYLAQCLFFCFAVKSLPALPSEGRSV